MSAGRETSESISWTEAGARIQTHLHTYIRIYHYFVQSYTYICRLASFKRERKRPSVKGDSAQTGPLCPLCLEKTDDQPTIDDPYEVSPDLPDGRNEKCRSDTFFRSLTIKYANVNFEI